MVYSIIQKSQLEGATRLDAEYYQPEFLELDKKINKFKNYLLKEIIFKFSSGKNLEQTEYSDKLPKFIRTQNVRPIIIDKNGLSSLSQKEKNYPRLSEGDLLFVRVGEGVGNSSVVTPEFKESSFSDNVIRSRVEKLDPYFVSIFLNSRLGYLYWERVSKGTARSLVSSENISSIRIPFLGKDIEKYCKEIILQASDLLKDGENLYWQAEDLLSEEFKINNGNNKKSFVVKFPDIEEAGRMDAEYFQPKYYELIKQIKENCNGAKLGDLVTIKKGFEPGAEEYKEEGRLFIRVSTLSKNGINLTEEKYLSEKLYEELKKDYEPNKGEILLSKDATPGIAYVVKDDIEGIISGGILRLQLKNKDVEDEYLTLCLNSIVGQMQAERDAGGSVIAHWKPEQIKNVIIPILPKEKQQKITSLIRESFAARVKAKELLEEAKRKVEEMIEKGGDKNDS